MKDTRPENELQQFAQKTGESANIQLNEFQNFVFSTIAHHIGKTEFNLYDLVKNTISHKDVSSQLDDLIGETTDAIYKYLQSNNLITEIKEKRVYSLTSLGMQMKDSDFSLLLQHDQDSRDNISVG